MHPLVLAAMGQQGEEENEKMPLKFCTVGEG